MRGVAAFSTANFHTFPPKKWLWPHFPTSPYYPGFDQTLKNLSAASCKPAKSRIRQLSNMQIRKPLTFSRRSVQNEALLEIK